MAKGAGYIGGQPDTIFWMKNVRQGIQFRKKHAYQDHWDTWRKYYRGKWDGRVMPYNLFFKMIRTLVPRVYFRNPTVSIMPGKPGLEYAILAQVMERIDNKLITQMDMKTTFKRMIQDGFMFGTAIGKLGYGAEFTPTPDMLDTQDPRNKKGHRLEYNDLVQPNMPWFLRVPPGHFIVPDGCSELKSARWCAHWIQRHIDDVKEDPRLKNVKDLNPVKRGFRDLQQEKPSREGMIDLVEIRDKKAGTVIILNPYGDEGKRVVYFEDDEMQYGGRLPFRELVFNWDDEYFWGIPDAQILDPLQREKNEIRTLIMKHRRLSIKKFLVKMGSLSPDEEAKLTDESDVGAVIHTEGEVQNIKDFTLSDIPQGLMKSDMLADQDVKEILGLGQNQWGEFVQGSEKPSATEAQIVNAASSIRTDERRDTVADMLVSVVKDANNVIFDHWTGDQVVDLVGPAGVRIWVQFTPDMLRRGAYELSIDPDSSLPETRDRREAKAVQSYGLLKTNPLINPTKLTAFLLRELHGQQYDDMMIDPMQNAMQRGIGSPEQPMSVPQYGQLIQRASQILPPGGGQRGGNVVPLPRR